MYEGAFCKFLEKHPSCYMLTLVDISQVQTGHAVQTLHPAHEG